MLNVVYWLIDRQYEGKSIRQLISSNLRLPLIVDFLIIAVNDHDLNINNVLACLLVIFALIDVFQQLIMAKGKIKIQNLF